MERQLGGWVSEVTFRRPVIIMHGSYSNYWDLCTVLAGRRTVTLTIQLPSVRLHLSTPNVRSDRKACLQNPGSHYVTFYIDLSEVDVGVGSARTFTNSSKEREVVRARFTHRHNWLLVRWSQGCKDEMDTTKEGQGEGCRGR